MERTAAFRFKRPGGSPNTGEKPETFDFLGFTHYWGKSRKGNPVVRRKTSGKRLRRTLGAIKEWGWKHRHRPLKEQQEQINRKLNGHYAYYGIIGNSRRLREAHHQVKRLWHK